jgi:predicted ATP-dependent serine protease
MKRATSSAAEDQDVAALHKTPTGVEGFDVITGGALPRNRTSLIFGGPGSGKTVFALQTLVNGARQFGEPGIFVAFEENSRHILANAASGCLLVNETPDCSGEFRRFENLDQVEEFLVKREQSGT